MLVLRNALWTVLAASVAMVCQFYGGVPYGLVVLFLILILSVQGLVEWLLHEARQNEEEIRERELLAAATQLMNGLIDASNVADVINHDQKGDHCRGFAELPAWAQNIYKQRGDKPPPLPGRYDLVVLSRTFPKDVCVRLENARGRNCSIWLSLYNATENLVAMASELYKSRDQDITATRQTARRVRFQVVNLLLGHAAASLMEKGQFEEILMKHGKPEALRDALEESKMQELVLGDAKPWRDDLLKFVLFRKGDGNASKADVE